MTAPERNDAKAELADLRAFRDVVQRIVNEHSHCNEYLDHCDFRDLRFALSRIGLLPVEPVTGDSDE